MEKAITIPPPPYGEPDAENAVRTGDVVLVSLQDGTNLSGKIALFNAQQGFIAATLKGRDTPVKIPMDRMQIMHLPTPKKWTDQLPDSDDASLLGLQHFRVIFKDGSEMDGNTLGYREDENGVHVYPKHSLNKFLHSFIPYHSIQDCVINDITLLIPECAEEIAANIAQNELMELLDTKPVVDVESLEVALKRQQSMPHMKLGEILVGENLVTEEQLNQALEDQKTQKGTPLGELLVERELVTTQEIQKSLAKKLGIPFIDMKNFQISPDALKYVPYEITDKHIVIPVHYYEDKLVVAIENPMNWDALDALRFHTNMHIEPVMATEEDIRKSITLYYAYSATEVSDESITDITDDDAELEAFDSSDDMGSDEEDIADNVVVKLLNKIIIDAHAQGVSDIHVEPSPGKEKVRVRYRKDGSLIVYHELPAQYKNALISRIKILSKLDISERRRPQDGKIEFKQPNGEKLELRVAIVPTTNGQEDVVMRILASGKPIPLEKLALSDQNYDNLKKAVSKPYGLFLVCGPTGSGKTTTLHSVLGYINTPDRKIWTAEDPVEITQKGLRQVQVNAKIGLDFSTAMRAFLRADPDVIMVGEMRDKETVHTGIEASLTGHLVFSTLHTNSAPESITRLLDMGMDPFNFADALLGILAQRLAKRLCVECKEAYVPDEEELNHLIHEYCQEFIRDSSSDNEKEAIYNSVLAEWQKKFANDENDIVFYKNIGCTTCDKKGYAGRVGLHELLVCSDAVKKDILELKPVSQLLLTALNEGMRTLRQDGIEKVLQGITDIHAVRAVCAK